MKRAISIILLVISFQLLFIATSFAVTFNPIRIEMSPIKWDPILGQGYSKSPAKGNFIVSYTDRFLIIQSNTDNDFEVDIVNDSNQVVIYKAYASGVGTYSISLAGLSEGEYSIYITTKKGTLYGTFALDSDL